jgi:hypothetical protein
MEAVQPHLQPSCPCTSSSVPWPARTAVESEQCATVARLQAECQALELQRAQQAEEIIQLQQNAGLWRERYTLLNERLCDTEKINACLQAEIQELKANLSQASASPTTLEATGRDPSQLSEQSQQANPAETCRTQNAAREDPQAPALVRRPEAGRHPSLPARPGGESSPRRRASQVRRSLPTQSDALVPHPPPPREAISTRPGSARHPVVPPIPRQDHERVRVPRSHPGMPRPEGSSPTLMPPPPSVSQ